LRPHRFGWNNGEGQADEITPPHSITPSAKWLSAPPVDHLA
jgi:hypothetical protein